MKIKSVLAQASAVLVVAGLAACTGDKSPNLEPAAPAASAAPAAQEAPTPATPTVSIESFDLGSTLGPDYKLTAPSAEFSVADTVYASMIFKVIGTEESLPGSVDIKWLNIDTNTLVKEEKKDLPISNSNVLNLALVDEDGMVPGKYKVDVSLNGAPALVKNFVVK